VFAFLFRGAVYGTMVLAPLLLLAALVVERTAPHPPSEPLAPSAPGN
jgi:hypothetical protein